MTSLKGLHLTKLYIWTEYSSASDRMQTINIVLNLFKLSIVKFKEVLWKILRREILL